MYDAKIVFEAYHLYNNYKSSKKVSSILRKKYNCKLTRQTVMNWINDIKIHFDDFMNKRFKRFNKKPKNKHISIDVINDVGKIINIDPYVTFKQIIETIRVKHKILLTTAKIYKIFKILNVSRKKVKYHTIKSVEYLDNLTKIREKFRL